jgi:hypothetical protein
VIHGPGSETSDLLVLTLPAAAVAAAAQVALNPVQESVQELDGVFK